MTDDREARLPKWARQELATLRRINREVTEHLAAATISPGTRIVTEPYSSYGPKPVGGYNDNVRFYTAKLDGRDWFDVRLNDDNSITLMGSEGLYVKPQSGNVVRIEHVRRFDR
ncbi:DUF7239 family protein [Kribbella sp. WER1]